MTISDEILMAYVDEELDAPARAAVEQAIAADPELARRVARQRALRETLRAAFDGVLREPVPERLVDAARNSPAPSSATRQPGVSDLAQARAAQTARRVRPRWSWSQWSAIAASVAIGAIIAHFMVSSRDAAPFTEVDGKLVARAELADALTNHLASTQAPDSETRIGVSFRSRSGDFCRTFVTRADRGLAGLACREGDQWTLEALARAQPEAGGTYGTASSALPGAVLQALQEQIAGEPLDADAEAAAKANGWRAK
ncbi:MAG TPA: hypothetical protein VH542_02105 [Steroidobacteraceae bacterium]|jgi:hypothetical protein